MKPLRLASGVLLAILIIAGLGLFGKSATAKPERETATAGKMDRSKTFRCLLWNYKGKDYRLRVRFYGQAGRQLFRVSLVQYMFETDPSFNPGSRSNLYVSRGGRDLWISPDALFTDSRWHIHPVAFTIPSLKKITVRGVADHGSAGDPACSLTARPL